MVGGPLGPDQERFVELLDTLINSAPFPGLARDRMTASVAASTWLTVGLPHVSGKYEVVVGLGSGKGTISYEFDHIHIYSDLVSSFLEWPPDAADLIAAIVGYTRWFLEGVAEVGGCSVQTVGHDDHDGARWCSRAEGPADRVDLLLETPLAESHRPIRLHPRVLTPSPQCLFRRRQRIEQRFNHEVFFQRMPEWPVSVHLVVVAPADLHVGEITLVLELGDDPLRRPFGDANQSGDVSCQDVGIRGDTEEHVAVIGEEGP